MPACFDVCTASIDRNLFVEASAGTGKTFTIEQLYVRRLQEYGTPPLQMGVVTFTNACARELRRRIGRRLEQALEAAEGAARRRLQEAQLLLDRLPIYTIHGLCVAAIEGYTGQTWTWADGSEVERLIEDCIAFGLHTIPSEQIGELLESHRMSLPSLVQEVRRQLWNAPEGVLGDLRTQCRALVAAQLKRRCKLLPDMVLEEVAALCKEAHFQEWARQWLRLLIVDEFQDTDPLQWDIVRALPLERIYVVGDPKQAIYSFRGADVYSYVAARQWLGDEARVSLTTNYRSTPPLNEALNGLFAGPHAPLLFYLPRAQESVAGPPLRAARTGDGELRWVIARGSVGRGTVWPSHAIEEAQLLPVIAREARALPQGESVAVLVRDRYQAKRVERFLQAQGIAAAAVRADPLVQQEPFAFMQRLVRAMRRGDSVELLASPPWGLPLDQCGAVEWLSELRHLLAQRGVQPWLGRLVELIPLPNATWRSQLEQIGDLLTARDPYPTLAQLDNMLRALDRLPDDDAPTCQHEAVSGEVQVLTLHSSKGLEFDTVFALGLSNRTPKGSEDPFETDCEKLRQFYVGCTRARRRLDLFVVEEESHKALAPGTASPMELFLTAVRLGDDVEAWRDRDRVYSMVREQQLERYTTQISKGL